MEQVLAEAVGVDRRAVSRVEQRSFPAWAVVGVEGRVRRWLLLLLFCSSLSRRSDGGGDDGGGGDGGGERWCGKLSSPLLYGLAPPPVKPPMGGSARLLGAHQRTPTQHCGGGGGDGGGGGAPGASPVDAVSAPRAYRVLRAVAAVVADRVVHEGVHVSLRTPWVFEQATIGGCGGGGDGAGGGGGDGGGTTARVCNPVCSP